jgi:arsenate reductase
MKTLFVCRANVGRSQAAMELYNLKFPGRASSAGTIVDMPGELLKYRPGAENIINAMREYGLDMSENKRSQLRQSDLEQYDQIVVMAEPETVPDWLAKNLKTLVWDIPDPKDQTLERTREIVADIKARIDSLE